MLAFAKRKYHVQAQLSLFQTTLRADRGSSVLSQEYVKVALSLLWLSKICICLVSVMFMLPVYV